MGWKDLLRLLLLASLWSNTNEPRYQQQPSIPLSMNGPSRRLSRCVQRALHDASRRRPACSRRHRPFHLGNSAAVARVQSATPVRRLDGRTYIDLALLPPPAIGASFTLGDISVFKPTARSGVSEVTSSRSTVQLDSLQGGIRVGDRLVIERDGSLLPFQVTDLAQGPLYLDSTASASASSRVAQPFLQLTGTGLATPIGSSIAVSPRAVRPFLQVTSLTVSPALPTNWASPVSKLTVHFGMVRAGSLTAPAKTRLNIDDLLPGAAFVMPVEPPALSRPAPCSWPARTAAAQISRPACPSIRTRDGRPDATAERCAVCHGPARAGHGVRQSCPCDARRICAERSPWQRRRHDSVPVLQAEEEAAHVSHRRVGAKWPAFDAGGTGERNSVARGASFFGAGPQDEVFIVRQNEDGESIVTFGDGETGARLPSGVKNVTATYRFGAGASKPPANLITQMSRPVPGIRRVVNPVGAGGGADADAPKDLQRNAPESALLLGRAVSLPDFEALTREFGGV